MHEKDAIQQAIQYMESRLNLDTKITLEEIAGHVGFSAYHFHRLFRSAVGMNIGDYLRSRRLCQAAQLLLHTDESILFISLACQFESQEAFTRAFKKIYGMPPGRYRNIFRHHGDTLKGEKTMENNTPQENNSPIKDWFLSGSHPQEYEFGRDTEVAHLGKSSAFLSSINPSTAESFATIMQQFNAKQFIGRRMKFTGFVKTEGVQTYCGLWMRVDNSQSELLQFDNMNDRRITGDTNWNQYTIVLDIPDSSALISIGVLLMGEGKLWVDSFQFEEVDRSVPTTNLDVASNYLEGPSNLSFDE